MACMKCGKELGSSQTFCDECLEEMKKNPVSHSEVVRLPQRSTQSAVKKRPRRHHYFWDAEEKIEVLRLRLRWLTFAFVITLLCLAVCLGVILWLLHIQGQPTLPFSDFFGS